MHDDHEWPWRPSLYAPDCRYARLRAKSPTDGEVTLILVDKPGEDRVYVFCLATEIRATRLLRVWSRRHLIEQVFRTLKHLLATGACHVHSDLDLIRNKGVLTFWEMPITPFFIYG